MGECAKIALEFLLLSSMYTAFPRANADQNLKSSLIIYIENLKNNNFSATFLLQHFSQHRKTRSKVIARYGNAYANNNEK